MCIACTVTRLIIICQRKVFHVVLDFDFLHLIGLAQNADVVVHEATNTFLPGVDKDGNMRLVTKDAKIHGHSTPAMVSLPSPPLFVSCKVQM